MNNEKVNFLLNWNHFTDHLSACMTKLMTDSSYSDIIIATADKHMIYSHRFVLANSSKYFQRLLKHMNRQRGIQLVVALPEIKYEIFKILMNYMYKGETQVPHELLPSVIKAGQFLEINGLVNLNETDSSGSCEGFAKFNFSGDPHPRCSIIHSSNSTSNHESEGHKMPGRMSSTLRDKIHSRENTNNSSKGVFRPEKKMRSQSTSNNHSSESANAGENGKENRSKVNKTIKCKNMFQEKKDFIQLPLKRKSSIKETTKKTSPAPSPSSSLSPESSPAKKVQKRLLPQEPFQVKVKDEKENNASSLSESEDQEGQGLQEKITIKTEAPDEVEVVYNELQCEFCHEVYTSPSDWVKHMTDQHGDRGYQTYKDIDKCVGGNAVITCVVCSCVCFSAAEWATHLRMWHTDRELAVANLTGPKKSSNKVKKKSGKVKFDSPGNSFKLKDWQSKAKLMKIYVFKGPNEEG